MANYDAGHYFLTFMAPIDRNGFVEVDGQKRSTIDHLRALLLAMPRAHQDDFDQSDAPMSPFARVAGTHFARFFVLDDVAYNGRRPSNAILDLLFNVQMTVAEQIDTLPTAYLVMTLDFDAMDGSDASLRGYTDRLWEEIPRELTDVFEHCIGFETVENGETFFDFIRQGQITTTMPFNDYWAYGPPAKSPMRWIWASGATIAALGFAAWITGGWALGTLSLLVLCVVAFAGSAIGLIYYFGSQPFPNAPDSDLPSVLKALYIQQQFVGFSMDHLGVGGQELYDAFDTFCETHKPNDITGPTQPSGVLTTDWTGA